MSKTRKDEYIVREDCWTNKHENEFDLSNRPKKKIRKLLNKITRRQVKQLLASYES